MKLTASKYAGSVILYPLSFILFSLSFVLYSCNEDIPEIKAISPRIGGEGTPLEISGSGFGQSQDESYVTIGGVLPLGRAYTAWTDNSINVTVPPTTESALVYVHRNGRKSNPMLFSLSSSLPEKPATTNLV